jgi:hypothetical protein
VAVVRAEATREVQHQGTAHHWLTKIIEGVYQTFHLAAVLLHGEVPLGELVELSVEVESPSVLIPEELFLESEPRLAARVCLVGMMSWSSTLMVPWSHESTTVSIMDLARDGGATMSSRTWSMRAKHRRVSST